jgi:hypothetical protein
MICMYVCTYHTQLAEAYIMLDINSTAFDVNTSYPKSANLFEGISSVENIAQVREGLPERLVTAHWWMISDHYWADGPLCYPVTCMSDRRRKPMTWRYSNMDTYSTMDNYLQYGYMYTPNPNERKYSIFKATASRIHTAVNIIALMQQKWKQINYLDRYVRTYIHLITYIAICHISIHDVLRSQAKQWTNVLANRRSLVQVQSANAAVSVLQGTR